MKSNYVMQSHPCGKIELHGPLTDMEAMRKFFDGRGEGIHALAFHRHNSGALEMSGHLVQATFGNLKDLQKAFDTAWKFHAFARPEGTNGICITCPADVLPKIRKAIETGEVPPEEEAPAPVVEVPPEEAVKPSRKRS